MGVQSAEEKDLTDTLEIFSGRLVLELTLKDCLSTLFHGQGSEIGNCRQKVNLGQRQGKLSIFKGAEQFDLSEVYRTCQRLITPESG